MLVLFGEMNSSKNKTIISLGFDA